MLGLLPGIWSWLVAIMIRMVLTMKKIIALVLVFMLILAGCSSQTPSNSSAHDSSTSTPTAGMRTITDSTGRQVDIPVQVKSIVCVNVGSLRFTTGVDTSATSNLNQIAKRAIETRSIYESNIKDLQANYEKLWSQAGKILRGFSKIKR